MRQFSARVVRVESLSDSLRQIWLAAPPLGSMTSGQFVMARLGESLDPMLRRGLSLHRMPHRDNGSEPAAAFLFGVGKTWSNWLAGRRPGDSVDLIGPLGHGFRRDRAARHLLLVSEGIGLAPLVALAEEGVAAGCNVTLIMTGARASELYPIALLPPEVEVVAWTEDGSSGRRGGALDGFVELQPWADQIFLAGSHALVDGVRAHLKRVVSRQGVQVIVEERMACGVGACLGCVVVTDDGPVASCVSGPVFDLWSLRS